MNLIYKFKHNYCIPGTSSCRRLLNGTFKNILKYQFETVMIVLITTDPAATTDP